MQTLSGVDTYSLPQSESQHMERTPIRHASPLDSLVRRASSRRAKAKAHANLTVSAPSTPPRIDGVPGSAQQSPLLHTRFRTSTTTFNDYETIASDARSMASWSARDEAFPERRAPHESVASSFDLDDITARYRDSWRSSDIKQGAPSQPQPVPTVVVSPNEDNEVAYATVCNGTRAGRAPSRVQSSGNINFSRPGLPLVDRSEERKREVLMRHQHPSPSAPHGLKQATDVPGAPARSASPTSVYSSYSYYPLDAVGHPPASGASSTLGPTPYAPAQSHQLSVASAQPQRPPVVAVLAPPPAAPPPKPTTAQEYLQLGIKHHEENRLVESAACFEKSATAGGGCNVGMLMWGLAQRHGWGCEKSERAGFRWLRRAAEAAMVDLEGSRQGINIGAVKSELVIAVYEVGQSFYRGWGVEKDKKMGVSYFRLAARMGDPDAQQELAFCLANGKGCKKDMREAAQWYRAAVAQGASDIGLAWIYKDKYQ